MDARTTGVRGDGATGTAGLLLGTGVCTLDGLIPVEYLCPGDGIVCRQGARRLVAVTALWLDRIEIVRIRTSTLGHDQPAKDLLLAPGQRVLIRDWRALALYGVKVAAVPAARLVDGEFTVAETLQQARLYALRFAEDEGIYAEGLELACSAHVPTVAPLSA